MRLMGMHLIGVYLIGLHLIGAYLTGLHLIGVYLMDESGQRRRWPELSECATALYLAVDQGCDLGGKSFTYRRWTE